MKKKFLILIVSTFCLLSHFSFSQWQKLSYQVPYPANKIFTLDKDHVYAVNGYGSFFRTVDGGETWENIQSNTTKVLLDVAFFNSSTGYACGADGTFLKTTNGGNTWTECITNTILHLRSLYFLNKDTGLISGHSYPWNPYSLGADSGIILRTTDGGATFQVIDSPDFGIAAVSMVNFDTCYALCNTSYDYKIIRTTDMGNTWQTVFVTNSNLLSSIASFKDGTVYVSAQRHKFYRSSDFGISWDSVSLGDQIADDISFPTRELGFISGFNRATGEGKIGKTVDAGLTWNEDFNNYELVSVDVTVNDNHDTTGYALSVDGSVFKLALPSGIIDSPSIKQLSVTPNPFDKSLIVKISASFNGPFTFKLYSTLGIKIIEKNSYNNHFIIEDLDFLKAGVFLVVICDAAELLYTGKFVHF